MPNPIEAVFYIHGVSNERRGYSHEDEYRALNNGICQFAPAWPTNFGGAEWGWHYKKRGTPKSHELLTDAQRLLGSRAIPALNDPWDFTTNPARPVINGLREIYFYGFGDMFYYVSPSGKQAVRQAVAEQFLSYVQPLLKDNKPNPISLTLIGHSAGSVTAFDLLFYLFQTLKEHGFLTLMEKTKSDLDAFRKLEKTISHLDALRKLAQEGNLRIRRLITLGSPITPLACRNDAALEVLAAGDQFDLKDYGLTTNPAIFGKLDGPRWINIWDRDDPIAWPVEPLMKQVDNDRIVEDVYVDVSDLVSKAHNRYWYSSKVYKEIAERW